jgi:NADH-quinone oxidoreductase subunit H
VVIISAVVTAMFLGGWTLPWLKESDFIAFLSPSFGANIANLLAMLLGVSVFFGKVFAMIFFQMLIRWSMPRFRYDQVMDLGWKILLPLSLANIFLTALGILVVQQVTGS